MTREQLVQMALDAGGRMYSSDEVDFFLADLERFAALVAAAERERIIAENAPVIEKINAHIKALEDEIAAIRARSNT